MIDYDLEMHRHGRLCRHGRPWRGTDAGAGTRGVPAPSPGCVRGASRLAWTPRNSQRGSVPPSAIRAHRLLGGWRLGPRCPARMRLACPARVARSPEDSQRAPRRRDLSRPGANRRAATSLPSWRPGWRWRDPPVLGGCRTESVPSPSRHRDLRSTGRRVFGAEALPRVRCRCRRGLDEARRACIAELEAQGVDRYAYNTAASAADLIDLRRALGYRTWDVYGVSYGARLAQEAMARDGGRSARSCWQVRWRAASAPRQSSRYRPSVPSSTCSRRVRVSPRAGTRFPMSRRTSMRCTTI